MHVVGFIIRIFNDARSAERQISKQVNNSVIKRRFADWTAVNKASRSQIQKLPIGWSNLGFERLTELQLTIYIYIYIHTHNNSVRTAQ